MLTQFMVSGLLGLPSQYRKRQLSWDREAPHRGPSLMMDHFFPPSLEGASVLEIGCGEGSFCLEAKRRNADRVVGIDMDDERLVVATKLARDRNLDLDFFKGSITSIEELGAFDYVLCRHLLNRVLDPIHTIHKLIGVTRQTLILELADIDLTITKFAKKRPRQALLGGWRPVFRLLPYALRPGILAVDSHGNFLMTRNWIKNLLRAQRRDIDRIEIVDSDQPHRYFVLVHMRRLRALALVSGPAGVGKSELARRVIFKEAALKPLFGFDEGDTWQAMGYMALDEGAKVEAKNLLLEYNICRPVERDWGNYEDDPALTIARIADAKRVYVLVCPKEAVIRRLHTRGCPKSLPGAKIEWLAREYSRPGGYQRLYDRWISYCEAKGYKITYLDVSSRQIKAIQKREAMKLISPNSWHESTPNDSSADRTRLEKVKAIEHTSQWKSGMQ
jgi:SAM-dependent methyltransferase